ncbi:MAG: hypothetical protein PHW46_01470, partial [Candidatus Omnitrophica bacterium]|nr:hypothetical protein [Candidatus Omnitrophota bacterium]
KIVFAALKSEDLWNDIVILNDKGLQMYAERHRTIKERLGDGMAILKKDIANVVETIKRKILF